MQGELLKPWVLKSSPILGASLEFEVEGLGCREDAGLRVEGLKLKLQNKGFAFRVQCHARSS